jgi:oxygen-independent coproporphyrinogen III oxidase
MVEASLYIHIPLCTHKCDYCHFYVVPNKDEYKDLLMEGLRLEWDAQSHLLENGPLKSIYFGGGTPSLLGAENVKTILSWISHSNCEITLEANPENITDSLMKAYRLAGINRVSIGVQSLEDQQLSVLSRKHNSARAIEAIQATHQAGIENISIDLMYDLPGQTLESWNQTLIQAVSLPISHLSLYNLTIEPHTVFFKNRKRLQSQLPSEEISAQMYTRARAILADQGFQQYEISAFCKPERQSIHNSGYWTGRPFLGLGPSAFSYWKGARFQNVPRLHKWHQCLKENKSPISFSETLEPDACVRESLAIRLRLLEGVDLGEFQLSEEHLKTIENLVQSELLTLENNRLKLTNRGIYFYDTVATEII